jgi:hypothetical protein
MNWPDGITLTEMKWGMGDKNNKVQARRGKINFCKSRVNKKAW